MDRGLPKARATKLCDLQSKRNTITFPDLERECGFWLAREHGESGNAPSSMNQGVVELACQAMALCVCG